MGNFKTITVNALILSFLCVFFTSASTFATAITDVDQVLANIQQQLLELEDFSAKIEILQEQNRRTVKTVAQLQASQPLGLARLEMLEPSVLRGQIVVADQDSLQVKMYLPIADQIMVRHVNDIAAEAGFGIDVTDFTTIFNFKDYTVTIDEVSQTEQGYEYLLQVEGFEQQIQRVWVTDQKWIPHKIAVYDQQVLQGTMHFHDIQLNIGLSKEQLSKLPNVREVVY